MSAPDECIPLMCPVDRHLLKPAEGVLHCEACGKSFPVVNGVPVLINDEASVFRVADYTSKDAYAGASGYAGSVDKTTSLRRAYRNFVHRLAEAPVLGDDIRPIDRILAQNPRARILVIGSGEREYVGDVTYTDVAFAPGIRCVCDAHDLPFADASFDAVVADSVLEHVCDPQRCVGEMVRVLKSGGWVWAITPFLQSVHMGAHDFTRFTYLGHRRLFRQFDDVASGMCGGPGYAAMHLIRHISAGITEQPKLRAAIRLLALLVTYPIRYIDRFLSRNQIAYNSACAFYFLGTKRELPLEDRELLRLFRGR